MRGSHVTSIGPQHARAIDEGFRAIHASGYGGELQQLAKLFNRRALPKLLQTHRRTPTSGDGPSNL